MLDMRQLLAGLEDYHKALTQQTDLISQEFGEVQRAWLALSECYEGTGADEFRPVWEGTSKQFDEYMERTSVIAHVLAERTEDLRRADQATGLNG